MESVVRKIIEQNQKGGIVIPTKKGKVPTILYSDIRKGYILQSSGRILQKKWLQGLYLQSFVYFPFYMKPPNWMGFLLYSKLSVKRRFGRKITVKRVLFLTMLFALFCLQVHIIHAEMIILFDEENDFVKKASFGVTAGCNPDITKDDVFHGNMAIRVDTPVLGNCQAYKEQIPDWNFPIREKPGKGEYRYLTFAWKTVGEVGIMIQFPDNGAWGANPGPCVEPPTSNGTRRYIDGKNETGWGGICIDETPPKEWRVYTRDLFEDFGEFVMTGMALTPFGTDHALYDYLMLAANVNEFPKIAAVSPAEGIIKTWAEIKTLY